MPTKPKSVFVLETEKRSHRTKGELAQRKAAEESLLSGETLSESPKVKGNKIAHKEFKRVQKLLKNIQKNDALYQGIINRYCLLHAECIEYEEKRERFYTQMSQLEEYIPPDGPDMNYFKTLTAMQTQINACDKQVMAKRKMMLDIEKECIMTIAAALRSVPKKVQGEEEEDDPMNALLNRQRA